MPPSGKTQVLRYKRDYIRKLVPILDDMQLDKHVFNLVQNQKGTRMRINTIKI